MLHVGESRRAARTEVYLDTLMAAGSSGAAAVPEDVDLDPEVRLAARVLRAELVRVHPSFRFEERLAARLAATAARMRAGLPLDEVADTPTPLAAFPIEARIEQPRQAASRLPQIPAIAIPAIAMPSVPARPLIVGGVASAALSLGAAYVAWRFSRPDAMTRAVRAAHATRAVGGTR